MATQPQPPNTELAVHHLTRKPPESSSPLDLLSIALQNNAAIDVIERLAALQEKAMMRDAEITFNDALSRVQAWGTEQEPFARAAYELHRDLMVTTVGFAMHPTISRFGASPDGLVGEDGLIQIKCPNTATHIEYLLAGVVPAEYEGQMLAEMACTGRDWCDVISFDPRLPEHLQLFIRRFERDNFRIAEIEEKVQQFLLEVDQTLARLRPLNPKGPAPIVPILGHWPEREMDVLFRTKRTTGLCETESRTVS